MSTSPRSEATEGSSIDQASSEGWCARSARPRPAAVPLALLLDWLAGEPPAFAHPVVLVGRAIGLVERGAPRDPVPALVYGAGVVIGIVGASAAAGALVVTLASKLPAPLGLLAEAWLLKTTFSARALLAAGTDVERRLRQGDLRGARTALPALVSRDATSLDAYEVTSAAVESLAENVVDSIVAPLLYYAAGGLPAALAYRAVNTLDAMIGYRDDYEYVGKAAARLDDLANLLPARLGAGLLIAGGALAGGHLKSGLACLLAHRTRTASPNAGWPMSAMAGLLGVRLEKRGHYVLGDPLPRPDLAAIDHAAEIVKVTTLLMGMLTFGLARLRRRGRAPHPPIACHGVAYHGVTYHGPPPLRGIPTAPRLPAGPPHHMGGLPRRLPTGTLALRAFPWRRLPTAPPPARGRRGAARCLARQLERARW